MLRINTYLMFPQSFLSEVLFFTLAFESKKYGEYEIKVFFFHCLKEGKVWSNYILIFNWTNILFFIFIFINLRSHWSCLLSTFFGQYLKYIFLVCPIWLPFFRFVFNVIARFIANIHLVYSVGGWTHNILVMSHLPERSIP